MMAPSGSDCRMWMRVSNPPLRTSEIGDFPSFWLRGLKEKLSPRQDPNAMPLPSGASTISPYEEAGARTVHSLPSDASIIPYGDTGTRTVYSMCGMCAVRCPIKVDVKNGKAVFIQGNDHDGAMGNALCARGGAGIHFEYEDERPQGPMIRDGERGSGRWRPVPWDTALDYVARGLREVIGSMGPRAIALSDRGGPFTDLTKTFLRALGSPNYFDHDCTCGRNCNNAARTVLGVGRGELIFDLKNCRHVVLYGRNLAESLMVKEVRAFMGALDRGMKCTYIDPRATVTASKATRYWQVRPNSDYALNLAIIHEILARGLYDKAFVERYVSGLDYLQEETQGCTPEWQERHTGIPAAALRDFVQEIAADAPKVIFHPGWMTARHKQSFHVSRSALIINALLGAIETAGGIALAKTPADAGAANLKRLVSRTAEPKDVRIDGAGTEVPYWDPNGGILHRMYSALATGLPYPIGAYVAYRHDPLIALPDPEAQKQLLSKLKLLVAIDVRYSETAWFADVILPESTYLERANIIAQTNGLRPGFSIRDQAIAPRFDTRPAWWIFREILRRVGDSEALNFGSIEAIWDFQLQGTGVTVEALRQKGFVTLASKPMLTPPPHKLKFKTPSGKIELESEMLKRAGHAEPAAIPEPGRAGGQPLLPALQPHGNHFARPVAEQRAAEGDHGRAAFVDASGTGEGAGHP